MAAAHRAPAGVLRRLCLYYLSCIANDDEGGVSLDARQGPHPEYLELPQVEADAPRVALRSEDAKFIHADGRPGMVMRLGFPVLTANGRNSGDPRRLLPLFLFDVTPGHNAVEPEWESCALNLEAIRALLGNGTPFARHALVQIETALQLNEPSHDRRFYHVLEALRLMYEDWPWATPGKESVKPLLDLPVNQIYERGMLIKAYRPYTQGLEIELQRLAELPDEALRGTALGALLFGESFAARAMADETHLLEVLPMNLEQRQAVRKALTASLSVVTGPPGTGKSQVVANILINSAWRRRPVLFASKNNKAVDVVDERVNRLGSQPVMVRLGAKEHRYKLAEHLTFLASGPVRAEDVDALREAQASYSELTQELTDLDLAERAALARYQDTKDQLAQLTALGMDSSDSLRRIARTRDPGVLRDQLGHTQDALRAALPSSHAVMQRATWPLWQPLYNNRLDRAWAALLDMLGVFRPAEVPAGTPQLSLETWKAALVASQRVIAGVERLQSYDAGLTDLRATNFGELAAKRNLLQEQLVATSARLWQAWSATQPAFLTTEQRIRLSRYATVLQNIRQSEESEVLPAEVRREYDRISQDAPEVVSCFSVTALSVRNRVPFSPGLFDLAVLDESSQCDIASALPILYRAKRAVIIGDPMQLKHIASLRLARDATFMAEQDLQGSHMDWQYQSQSLFGLVASRVPAADKSFLRDHHRSHQDIIGYSNEAFYADALRVVTRLTGLRRATIGGPAVRWIDVRGRAERGKSESVLGSVYNAGEARECVSEIRRLLDDGYTGSIGVVTPFAYQATRIRRELERDGALWDRLVNEHNFQCATAHGFQGDERDLMIFSVVAAEGLHAGAQRFLEDEVNVFNVALTRARAELVVIGDARWCLQSGCRHLQQFTKYAWGLDRPAALTDTGVLSTDTQRLTKEEQLVKSGLEGSGVQVTAHARIEQYQADLAVLGGAKRLAIDIVDRSTAQDWGLEALEREQLKRQRLLALGWTVLRFWPEQCRDDLPWVINQVLASTRPPAA